MDDARVAKPALAAMEDETNTIGEEARLLELTDRDMDALLGAIATPPAPNEAMLRSVARWRERVLTESPLRQRPSDYD